MPIFWKLKLRGWNFLFFPVIFKDKLCSVETYIDNIPNSVKCFLSETFTLSLFSWTPPVLFFPRKDRRNHSPCQRQYDLGEDHCCLPHLQPSYRCQPEQIVWLIFSRTPKSNFTERTRRIDFFTWKELNNYLSPGVPKLEKNWLQKSVPNVEQNRNNYAGNTHHSENQLIINSCSGIFPILENLPVCSSSKGL